MCGGALHKEVRVCVGGINVREGNSICLCFVCEECRRIFVCVFSNVCACVCVCILAFVYALSHL